MSATNNYPTVSTEEKFKTLKAEGKFPVGESLRMLSATQLYELDAAYDVYRKEKGTAPILGEKNLAVATTPTTAPASSASSTGMETTQEILRVYESEFTGHNVVDPSADAYSDATGVQPAENSDEVRPHLQPSDFAEGAGDNIDGESGV